VIASIEITYTKCIFGSGAHRASYPMGIGGSFLVGKAAGAWS